MFSHRVPPPGPANAWSTRFAARAASGALLDLTLGNPTRTGLSPLAAAAAALAAVGVQDYAPAARGSASARAAVAAALADRGAEVAPDDIVLTSSTSEAYAHLFRLLADPGEVVLAPVPSYPLFEPLAVAAGVRLRPYGLAFDGQWHLDRDAFERAAPGARAVIVVEPNNPTGSCLDAADRVFLERLAVEHGLAIVADEVFGDFPHASSRPLPTWLGERAVPTFVLGGLSKRVGLPHLKLGWIVLGGPEPARAEARAGLEWLADLFLSVGSPVQAALPALLELRHAFAARVGERVAVNLAALASLVRARPECSLLPAAGGWTAIVRVPATRTDEAWALALLDAGVAVHPGHFYDLENGEYLVVSLIVEPAPFAAGLDVIARVLA